MATTNLENIAIPRHKAALKRRELSLPMAAAVDAGILQPHHAHLDYGCGRGDDVRFLQAMGFRSRGYDPYYFPHTPKRAADVVTLLYVLSTVEVPMLRYQVLIGAYQLTRQTLVVSAITGRSANHPGTPCQRYLDAVGAMERGELFRINERRLLRIEAILDGTSE